MVSSHAIQCRGERREGGLAYHLPLCLSRWWQQTAVTTEDEQPGSGQEAAAHQPAVMASCSTNSHSEGEGARGARETSSTLAGFQAFGFYSLAPMKAWFPWEKTSCLKVKSAGCASRAQPGLWYEERKLLTPGAGAAEPSSSPRRVHLISRGKQQMSLRGGRVGDSSKLFRFFMNNLAKLFGS